MRYLAPIIILVMLLFFLWQGLIKDEQPIPSPLINKPIPDFIASDLIEVDQPLTKKMFLGHWSLLVVWASWCVSCEDEQAILLALKQNTKLHLYGLNYRDSLIHAQEWLSKQGNPYEKIINDPKGSLAIDLGVYGVPESFLIDPKGRLRYKQIGPLTQTIWILKMAPLMV